MKRLIVGLAVVALLGSGMGQAQQTQQAQQTPRSMNSEFAMSWITPVLSAIYFPVKFSIGTAGAVLGGVSGFVTGGNERAAEGIWRPLTGGSYFITPQVFDGEKPFLPLDGGPYAGPPTGATSSGSAHMQP